MFSFHKVTLKDMDWMKELLWNDGWFGSEYTFGANILWGHRYHIEAAKAYGCCLVRYHLSEEQALKRPDQPDPFIYSYPIGPGDKKAVLDDLIADARQQQYPLLLNSVSEKACKELMTWYPDQFLIREDRDYEDYVYDREKLATLSGRKMHKKRNHIARFKEQGEWSYEPLDDNNLEECRALCTRWVFSREDKWNDDMALELKVLQSALDLKDKLGLVGGVLRQKQQVVAFCMGEPVNEDVFVTHFEKALPEYQGAYPMINQQFALHACKDYKYINREDDAGDAGLRRSKLSYYPEILLKKYTAALSPIIFARRERHEEDIITLWQTCFQDDAAFVRFYLDHCLKEDTMLLYMVQGKPVAMASFLPMCIQHGEEKLPARYVYAVATLPAYRGRGYARSLLNAAKELWNEPLVLSPAEESLCDYYHKQDFISVFSGEKWDISTENSVISNEKWEFEEISADLYKEIRDLCFAKDGYVEWDQAFLSFALEYNRQEEGKALCCTHPAPKDAGVSRSEDILLYKIREDTLVILETTLAREDLSQAASLLLKETGCSRALYQQPVGMLWVPQDCPLGLDPGQGYFNLELGD